MTQTEKIKAANQEITPTIIWPTIFINGLEPDEYRNSHYRKWKLCADAFTGWGNTCFDNPPPNFGKGMQLIGEILNISPLPDELKRWIKEHPVPQ